MNDINSKFVKVPPGRRCPDGMEIPAMIKRFCHSLEQTLLADMEIPVAFAVMTRHEVPGVGFYHNVFVGHSEKFLPKGGKEARKMLMEGLREWEDSCYPGGKIIQRGGSG